MISCETTNVFRGLFRRRSTRDLFGFVCLFPNGIPPSRFIRDRRNLRRLLIRSNSFRRCSVSCFYISLSQFRSSERNSKGTIAIDLLGGRLPRLQSDRFSVRRGTSFASYDTIVSRRAFCDIPRVGHPTFRFLIDRRPSRIMNPLFEHVVANSRSRTRRWSPYRVPFRLLCRPVDCGGSPRACPETRQNSLFMVF